VLPSAPHIRVSVVRELMVLAGRHIRHSAVNDLIKRALASADIPAKLEPSSLSRDDGMWPDGLSTAPWKEGR